MGPSTLTFLLFLGSLGLLFWKPEVASGKVLHLLVWMIISSLSGIALLFALFNVWWQPAQTWSVVWSVAAVAVLTLTAILKIQPTD